MSSVKDFFVRLSFGKDERHILYTLIGDLCATNMEFNQVLEVTADLYKRQNKTIVFILEQLRESIKTNRFQQTISKYIPAHEAALFSQFGKTDSAILFASAARIAYVDKAIKEAILSALIAPVAVIAMLFVLFYFLGSQFFPILLKISEISTWPTSWQIIAKISLWIAGNYLVLLAILVGIYAAFKLILNNYVGPGRKILDRYPPFVFNKILTGAIFTFVLIENARVGTAINTEFINSAARSGNKYFRSRLLEISKHLASSSIGEAVNNTKNDWPDQELNLILKALSSRKNWVEPYSQYCDLWLKRVQVKVTKAAHYLKLALFCLSAAVIVLVASILFGLTNIIS